MPHVAPNRSAVCVASHAPGTLIETDRGPVPVESLVAGDLVATRDNGLQPVRWVGARALDAAALDAAPALRPVRIRAGALGPDRPSRDLVVSPEHGVLIADWRAELLFGQDEVLAPARALINDATITRDHGAGGVTYYHFLFDRHEIVLANGIECESFHPAEAAVALDNARRAELLRLFPELALGHDAFGPAARAVLTDEETAVLLAA